MSRDRELRVALVIAGVLVLARSVVYAAYEQAHFDSDQATIGLMAKHLSEGRAFPLFFYGQSYMLGVEAWLAAPLVWIAGPTVAALRTSLILTNLAVVTLLVVGLTRWGGVRPLFALTASAFFAFAPPVTAARLVEAQGGNIEPFLYVLILWWIRRRPLWFGAVLAIGVMNREFTVYAVPVLIIGQIWDRALGRAATWRAWLLVAIAFSFVWQGVHALEPLADLGGPGTRGTLLRGFAGSEVGEVMDRVDVSARDFPRRLALVTTDLLPRLIGGRAVSETIGVQGRDWMRWPMAGLALAAIVRIAVIARTFRRTSLNDLIARDPVGSFSWYLLGIGVLSVVAYALTRPPDPGELRYMLLGLLVPVGLIGVWLGLETRTDVRRAIVVAVVAWGVCSAIDNVDQIARYVGGRQPNDLRAVADALVSRGVHVAEAPYWRAYKLTFLTGERVKVASTDYVRIQEYQQLASDAGAALRRLEDRPCVGGETLAAGWYLCPRDRK